MAILTRNSNSELLELPNCAGLSEAGECYWLNIPACQGESCPFKHTKEERITTLKFIKNRLATLDETTQSNISKKYYGGTQPWNQPQ